MAKVHSASAAQSVILWEHAVPSTHSALSNSEPFPVNFITWKTIVVGCFSVSALKTDGLDLLSDREFFIEGKGTNNFQKHSKAIHESQISLSSSSFYIYGTKKKQ